MRQYTKPFYSLAVRVCVRVEAYTLSAWRSAKGSSDECEAAATDVHAQFLGIGPEFTQELRLDNQPLETLVLVRVLGREFNQKKEQKRREKKGQVGRFDPAKMEISARTQAWHLLHGCKNRLCVRH